MINLEVPHVAKSLKWDLDWGSYPKMDALFFRQFSYDPDGIRADKSGVLLITPGGLEVYPGKMVVLKQRETIFFPLELGLHHQTLGFNRLEE